jgi:peptide chain release factor
MILLQLSSGQGPVECALAVAHALKHLQQEAATLQVHVNVIEQLAGPAPGTYGSVLMSLDGDNAPVLAQQWCGTLLWVCASPYRPQHGRKNWYFSGELYVPPAEAFASAIRFETLRASGPGGQHVNKTESAVRATHLASGLSVKVQSERSQHANKRLAILLLARRVAMHQRDAQHQLHSARRLQHHQLVRGNPQRCFVGPDFRGQACRSG